MRQIPLVFAVFVLATASVHGQAVTFDFDTGTPTLVAGQSTPFQHTVDGVTAQFSSPEEWLSSPAFSIQSEVRMFYTLSLFEGLYLDDARTYRDRLQVRFSTLVDGITLDFATTDLHDNTEVPSNITLRAYLNSTDNFVGSATTHGTFTTTDTFPQGTLSFNSGGSPFNLVQLVVEYQPSGTSDFLVDNITVNTVPVPEPSVIVFYNRSAWDNRDAAANAADDGAIALNKGPLLPGGTASFANYTSYDKGINGLMIDLFVLPGTPTLNDFLFRIGNDNKPYGDDLNDPADDWLWAPDPIAISVRPGEGQGGANRVTLIWADGAIRNCWLQVTLLATDATGLTTNKVFYVGNAAGECGNSFSDTLVNATDEIGTRNHPRNAFNPALIDDCYDFNRDRLVNATDQIIARNNRTNAFTALRLITPPLEGP